ncbi:MAG: LCP family protein [bacterium]
MLKRKLIIFFSAVAIACVSTIVGGWLFLYYRSGKTINDIVHNPSEIVTFTHKIFYGPSSFNIVILGRDYDYDNRGRRLDSGRTDTIMVFHVDCKGKKINGISIPRDTIVNIPRHGESKINAAYHIGGVPLAIEVIEDLLGIKIDYYVLLDPDTFKRIVDAIGGVEIYVEKDMRYKDSWGNLYIDLKKGYQRLNGVQAEGYVRFRYDSLGDIGRIERQQKFLYALLSQVTKPNMIVRVPTLIQELSKYIHTNLPVSEMISLVTFFVRERNTIQLKTTTLPGSVGRNGYWYPDLEETSKLISMLFTDIENSSNTAQAKVLVP